MGKNVRALACAGLLLLAAGCTTSDPTAQTQFFPIVFTDFPAATPLAVPNPGTEVFRDQASWDAFWQLYAPLGGPAPAVDFSQDMLIGVFWGATGTGCFQYVDVIDDVRVRIDGVNTVGVIQVDLDPLPDLGNCAMPVNPLQMVLVETTITPVVFAGMVPG